jgi:iron complex outermembrane receptor protein
LRLALGVVGIAFFIFPLGVFAQDSERIVIQDEYHPNAETEGAWRLEMIPTDLMEKAGSNTPIEGLRQLPIFVGTTATENNSNGGNGSALINLYALGSNNVLTLINGRRAFSFSDVNAIPMAALSRTEIFDSGLYGSDSAGGVVNFILLNGPGEAPYGGAELHILYGNTTDSDAHVRQVYLRGGVSGLDGRVSIAATGEYYSRANLYARDRPDVARSADTSNGLGDSNYPGSVGMQWGGLDNNSPTFGGRVSVSSSVGVDPVTGTPLSGALVLINPGTNQVTPASYRRFDVMPGIDPSRFNFRAFTPAIPAVEKAMYFVTGRYKIFGDGLQLYGDVMYSHTKQDNAISGTPFSITGVANGRNEARASIFNPFGNNLSSVSYRLQQELGNRRSFFDHDYQRYVAGINGDCKIKDNDFISRFGYDSGFVYDHFREQRVDSGDATRSGIRSLIAANTFNPFIGALAPIMGTAPTYVNGVPTGLIAPYDNTSARALLENGGASYIGHSLFLERDFLYDAKANAHLFPNWWNGGFDLALGYEHRENEQHSLPDPVQVAGDQLGFNPSPNTKARQEVDSFFTELYFPVITSTMNVPFVRSLDLTLGWRYENFDSEDQLTKNNGSFDNSNSDENLVGCPSVSLRYQPNADLTFRASWRQAIRPPTFQELFAPVTQNFPVFFGPPIGVIIQPQLGIWQGGNPTLKPEKTDAYSAGVVWSPKFVPGLFVTMDWYQLFTRDLILDGTYFWPLALAANASSGGTAFVDPDGCGGGSGAAVAPGGPGVGITRDPVSGTVVCIDSVNSNAGKRLVQGVEVNATYDIPTERFGRFIFSVGWNHFFTWKAEPLAGTGANSFLGTYNNGTLPFGPGAIPFNKGFLRGEWEWRHFDFVATGNYIGDFRDDPSFDSIVRDQPRNVPSYITLDMQLSYEFVKPAPEPMSYAKDSKDNRNAVQTAADNSTIWQRMLWGTKFTVGVNNAFDRNPPSVLAAFNDNYDTSLYSIRNRYYYVALTKKF